MNSLPWLFRWFFGCPHAHLTSPMAPIGGFGRDETVKCLDCGQQFRYSWADMRITGPLDEQAERPTWRRWARRREATEER